MQILEYINHFQISVDYNHWFKRNNELVKEIPGHRWNHSKKVWTVPLHQREMVMSLARKTKAEIIKIDIRPEQLGEIDTLPELRIDLPINATLRPYQKNGIQRAIDLKRLIIGDEQGLGKTLISISTIVGLNKIGEKVFPCLVICPASTKINWQREWERFSNHKTMILDDKNKANWHRFYEMGLADVFITNYESLKKFFVHKMPNKGGMAKDIELDPRTELFNSFISDESHRLKSTQTQQSKIVLRIAQGKNVRILLTGTPVVNKPLDLFPQLAILGRLPHFGGGKTFRNRYCEGGRGAANLKELNYLLNKHCFFRREKKDVAKDLPEKQRQTILCDITTRNEYNKALHDFTKFLEEKGCTDLEIAKKMRGEIMVKMGELKKISARGKLNEVKEFISEVLESGEKLILFAVHHEIVDSILKEFPNAVTVTGRDDQNSKQRSIDAFQNDTKTQLIVCNIKAAGVGITLTASSRVAFIEYPWTYADCVQCEDRAHRIGQVNNVMCTYFLGQSTIDEDLYRMIQQKRHVANTITGATDQMEMNFVDSIVGLFTKTSVA